MLLTISYDFQNIVDSDYDLHDFNYLYDSEHDSIDWFFVSVLMKILKILLACKNPTIIKFKKNLEKCEIL